MKLSKVAFLLRKSVIRKKSSLDQAFPGCFNIFIGEYLHLNFPFVGVTPMTQADILDKVVQFKT